MLCMVKGESNRGLLERVMEQLTWERLKGFLDGQDPAMQVHAIGILQNVAHSDIEDVRFMADAFGGTAQLLASLERLLQPALPVAVTEHALYTLNNLSTTSEEARDLLMANPPLLEQVLGCVVRWPEGGWGGGGGLVLFSWRATAWRDGESLTNALFSFFGLILSNPPTPQPQERASVNIEVAALWTLVTLTTNRRSGKCTKERQARVPSPIHPTPLHITLLTLPFHHRTRSSHQGAPRARCGRHAGQQPGLHHVAQSAGPPQNCAQRAQRRGIAAVLRQ